MNKKYRDINRYPYFFVSKIITNNGNGDGNSDSNVNKDNPSYY